MFNREAAIESSLPIKKELISLFENNHPKIIFDIGSCEGEDSIRYSRLFPESKVFSFEPLPDNQKLIRKNLEKYKVRNVELIPIALSDVKGVTVFHVSSGSPEGEANTDDWNFGNKSSSLLKPDKHLEITPWVKFNQQIQVQTNTIENVCFDNNITGIDFAHIDVQGAEMKVLEGAGPFLKRIKAIWMEVSDTPLYTGQSLNTEIEKFMKQNGFYLFMNVFTGHSGDQMYLNRRYFKVKCMLFEMKEVFRNWF